MPLIPDTLAYAKKLKSAGFTDEQAELVNGQLATKKDLAELKTEIIKWNTGTLLAATGLFTVIVKLM